MRVVPVVLVGLVVSGLCLLSGAAHAGAAALVVNGTNSPFTIATPSTFESVVVENGGTLIVNAPLAVNTDFVVQAGGNVTHDIKDADMSITATGTIDVQAGAFVDVVNKGFRGGSNGSAFGGNGEIQDPITLQTVAGAGPNNGGSHGGRGGRQNAGTNAPPATFGAQVQPSTFGSGGGNGTCSAPGGGGGGKLAFTASTVRVDGVVRADGQASVANGCGAPSGGGGGGGSIAIDAATFAGAGIVTADGGSAVGAGGGGGGRIFIRFTTRTFSGTLRAFGGGGSPSGEAGSVYLIDSTDALSAEGGHVRIDAAASHPSLTLRTNGSVIIAGRASVSAPIVVPATTTMTIAASDAFGALSVDPTINGTLIVRAPATFPTSMTLIGTMIVDEAWTVNGDLVIEGGALVTHTANDDDFALNATGTIHVKTAGAIDVSGRGFPQSQFFNPQVQQVQTTPSFIGGSHGGRGGGASAGSYDDMRFPFMLGSGGGVGACSSAGGAGGGKVSISASTFRVDGFVRADGLTAFANGCGTAGAGGAGGSIFVDVTTFSGAGIISATGGGGTVGGGGGRIAIYSATRSYSGTISALATLLAPENARPDHGSVYLEDDSGDLAVEGGVLTLGDGDATGAVQLRNNGVLRLVGAASITNVVDVPAGGTVQLDADDALDGVDLDTTIAGTLIVNAPAAIGAQTLSGTMVINDALTVNGGLTLSSGAVITHTQLDDDFFLDVIGTMDVRSGARVDVNGKGLKPGPAGGFGDRGQTIDATNGGVIAGANPAVGASHGGRGGGASPATYDDPLFPDLFGGGGGSGSCSSRGGDGGGRIAIRASSLNVSGSIIADGIAGTANGCGGLGGGGAGGTIRLDVGAFSGAGAIAARGGTGANGGGGGRIRIDVDNNTFTGQILVSGAGAGAVGTVTIEDSADGVLTVAGGVRVVDGDDAFTVINLGAGGILQVRGPVSVTQTLSIPAGATVVLADARALDRLRIDPSIAGTLQIDAPITYPENIVLTGTLLVDDRFEVASIEAQAGSIISHVQGVDTMQLVVSGTLDVRVGARIDADGRGFLPGPLAGFGGSGATIDPNTTLVAAGSGPRNGGSHVSVGGRNNTGAAVAASYDSATTPIHAGGGGGEGACGAPGGSGGGVVRFIAGAFILNGVLTSGGSAGTGNGCGSSAGGGAGGTVSFNVQGDWSGAGSVRVRGGNGGGGGGAGGVFVGSYATKSFTGTIDVGGGGGPTPGAAGQSTESVATEPPQIITAAPVDAEVGRLFRYRPLATGSPPLTWTLEDAPSGATVDAFTGEVLWMPPDTTPENFILRVTNSLGFDDEIFTVNPSARPLITSVASSTGRAGEPYHYDADDTASASGTPPFTWSAPSAPSGFTIDANTGFIAWTPATPGNFPACIRAASGFGASEQCFSVEVAPAVSATPPTITSIARTTGVVGTAYEYDDDRIATASGDAPISWSLLLAPTGFSINAATGAVSWTPDVPGAIGVCIVAANAAGEDTQCFTVDVAGAGGGVAPTITTTASTVAVVGVAYDYDADAQGDAPLTWSTLLGPQGFDIDATTGVVTWIPDRAGATGVCIVAANAFGEDTQCFNVDVVDLGGGVPPVITSTARTAAFVGVPYAYDDDATAAADGDAPIAWSTLLGPAEFGIDPNSGVVSWTPARAGATGVCIVATNAFGEDSECFTVNVELAAAPVFTSTPITLATQGIAYSYDADQTVSVSGAAPIAFSAPTAPPGFTIDESTGAVTWTPLQPGNVDVVIRATNPHGVTDQSFTVSVLPSLGGAAPVIVREANLRAAVGVPYLYDADNTANAGGDAPIRWSAVSAPSSFRIDQDSGVITWVPSTVGTVAITLVATNAIGEDSYSFAVEVIESSSPEPTPVAVIAPLVGDAPLAIVADGSASFAPPGSSIAFHRWTWGDGSLPSNGALASHVYERPGSYVARLRVADEVGVTGETSAVVRVSQDGVLPPAARVLVSSVDGADALEVSFSCDCDSGDAPIQAFLWDFGDGTQSNLATVTHAFGPGGFEVRLTVVDGNGLSASDSVRVSVSSAGNVPPIAIASATPAFGNAPLSVRFETSHGDSDGVVTGVEWDFGDGGTSTESAPSYVYVNPGIYTALVRVTDDGGLTTTATVEVDVGNADGVRPPLILSLPLESGAIGVAYNYDEDGLPAARGDRPLVWSLGKRIGDTLIGAPAGMAVDPGTGRITWTPAADQFGRIPVSLVASNDAGAVAQDWEIEIPEPPAPPPPPVDPGCACDTSTTNTSWPLFAIVSALLLLRRRRWRTRRCVGRAVSHST